jgi:hypothetical protein
MTAAQKGEKKEKNCRPINIRSSPHHHHQFHPSIQRREPRVSKKRETNGCVRKKK